MTDHIVAGAQKHLTGIPLSVISQGAEALVFKTKVHPYLTSPSLANKEAFIIKYRPPKPYRHPKIDASITKNRTIGEVRFMSKLQKLGVNAPAVILADLDNGIIWMEYLGTELPNGDVSSFKNHLWYLERNKEPSFCTDDDVKLLCQEVGKLIGKLHLNDMIHGDLTSSNILLQDGQPLLIDFGLSSYSGMPEDKAVDLYVLERAIDSTHSVYAKQYNEWMLEGYEQIHMDKEYGKQGTKKFVEVSRKLDDVRLRGRKRSMLG